MGEGPLYAQNISYTNLAPESNFIPDKNNEIRECAILKYALLEEIYSKNPKVKPRIKNTQEAKESLQFLYSLQVTHLPFFTGNIT